jgi:LEA14-like dessication related protein
MENFTVVNENDKFHLGFDYVIKNPNWYGIVIKPSSLKLTVADVDCGWVQIEKSIKIKRQSKAGYPFVLVGDGSKFVKSGFTSIWYLITGKGVDFNLKGKLKAGVAFFKKKWPMDYTYSMDFEEFLSLF